MDLSCLQTDVGTDGKLTQTPRSKTNATRQTHPLMLSGPYEGPSIRLTLSQAQPIVDEPEGCPREAH